MNLAGIKSVSCPVKRRTGTVLSGSMRTSTCQQVDCKLNQDLAKRTKALRSVVFESH